MKKKGEQKEQTSSGGSGEYSGPLFTEMTKQEFTESLTVSSITDMTYDAPFGTGGKDPLKIDGVKSIKNSRAVKDKKFPKWGGEGSVFVQIKEKCKKYPYCNQGNADNIEIFEGIDDVVKQISKESNIPIKIINEIILNNI